MYQEAGNHGFGAGGRARRHRREAPLREYRLGPDGGARGNQSRRFRSVRFGRQNPLPANFGFHVPDAYSAPPRRPEASDLPECSRSGRGAPGPSVLHLPGKGARKRQVP